MSHRMRMSGLSALLAGLLLVTPSFGQSIGESTSLSFTPSDVAFYSTSLRLRQQFDKFVNSNAYKKMVSLPLVQMGIGMAKAQWDDPNNPQAAMAKQMLADPANQQLVGMLKDMISHEVFLYGDANFAETLATLNKINMAVNSAQFEAMASGQDPNEVIGRKMMEVLATEEIKIPKSVMGFKLSDKQAATDQLARLEQLLNAMKQQQPQLAQIHSKETIGGTDYHTFKLNGQMVPWEQVLANASGDERAQLEKIAEQVKKMTLSISLGLRGDYLILASGDDSSHLNNIGQGQPLTQRPELAPLLQAGEKSIVAVSYVSKEFMQRVNNINDQVANMKQMADRMLPIAPVSDSVRDEMKADLEKLAAAIKEAMPTPGAVMSYEYETPRGYETFTYNWGENPTLDGSQKLSVLNHVGGKPLMFIAARGTSSPEDFDKALGFIKRLVYYGEQIGKAQMGPNEQQAYQKLRENFDPLLKQLGDVMRDKIAPALKDGQSAIVLDAKSSAKQWHMMLPPAENPLPMFELGCVIGVSDADKLKSGMGDIYGIVQAMLDKAHELSKGELKDMFPEEIPQITMPNPVSREFPSGTVYYYTFPTESGLDKQIAPNAGLSQNFAALSLMPQFTKRLLDDMPVTPDGPLANVDRPLASASYLDFAGIIGVIKPWFEYGTAMFAASRTSTTAQDQAMILDHVRAAMDILQCFRHAASVTYREGDAWVTHAEFHFQDLVGE